MILDPNGGMGVRIHLDSNGQDLTVEHVQDVTPILERNREMREDRQNCDWGRQIAEIPNVIYVRWLEEERAKGNLSVRMFTPEFDAIVKKKLYDPEWAYLRTDRPALQAGWMGN